MKRKYSETSKGLRPAKKQATGTEKYDVRTGRWTSGSRSVSSKAAASLRSAVMEKKGMDTTLSLTAGNVLATTNTNGGAFVLNLVQQGSGSWNRVGRKTALKSLRLQGIIAATATPDSVTGEITDNNVRMVVVWDKQPSGGAIPTFDAIFGITAQDGTESCPTIYVPPRYDNMERFRILRDCVVELDPEAVNAAGTTRIITKISHIDEYLKLPLLESNYSGQSSPMTIADISTGALYIYFRAQQNAAGLNQASVALNARIRYTD